MPSHPDANQLKWSCWSCWSSLCNEREISDQRSQGHTPDRPAYVAPSPVSVQHRELSTFPDSPARDPSDKDMLLPKRQSQLLESSAHLAALQNRRDEVVAGSSSLERSIPAVSVSGITVDPFDDGARQQMAPQHRRTVSHGKPLVPTWGLSSAEYPQAPGSGPLGGTRESRHKRNTSLSKNATRRNKGSSVGSASEISGPTGKVLVPQDEDDDFCPTCLEVYTKENPKIWTACAHHFHMPCIFEWMERKDTCPMCESKMVFVDRPSAD